MSDQGIKSKPTYSRISRDWSGRRHLLVIESEDDASGAFADGTGSSDFEERWRIVSRSQAIPSPHLHDADHEFRSSQHLMIALGHRLAKETMGFRLYVIGTEPFVWKINGLANDYGLGRHEVQLFAAGSLMRRVFCNHCRTLNEGVTTDIVTCSGCYASLFVRDHFSRRLNAYAGVQVDAEVPGEISKAKEIYL